MNRSKFLFLMLALAMSVFFVSCSNATSPDIDTNSDTDIDANTDAEKPSNEQLYLAEVCGKTGKASFMGGQTTTFSDDGKTITINIYSTGYKYELSEVLDENRALYKTSDSLASSMLAQNIGFDITTSKIYKNATASNDWDSLTTYTFTED